MIVCDTGPLVAAAISNDDHHRVCVDLLTSLHLARRKILVPGTVAAEVGCLLARDGGPGADTQFLESLADGTCSPVDLRPEDNRRAGEFVTTCRDLGLGTTDAAVIALCERLELAEVATIGRRHFTIVRPRHVDALVLPPE